jgi:hypothetical protein
MGFGSAVAGRIGVRRESATRLEQERGALRIKRYAVGTAMFVCGFALWTVAPAVVFWLVPRVSGPGSWLLDGADYAPLVAVVGAVVGALALAQLLAKLNALYCRLASREFGPGLDEAWRRPLCNENEGRREPGILEAILVSSVLTAGSAFVVWFFFIADCSAGGCA